MRTIFQTTHQLQGLLSIDGKGLDANATALALIGARLEDVTGRLF